MASTLFDGCVGRMANQLEAFQAASKEFTTFLDLFPRSDSVAIRSVDARRALTYKELIEFAEGLDLASFGISIRGHEGTAEESDRLCVMLPNGPELAVCFIAMTQFCTYAPLNPDLTEAELEFEVTDIPARALVVPQSLDNKIVNVAKRQQVPLIELVPNGAIAGIFELRWHASSPTTLPTQIPIRARRKNIALVLHTSGTTKKPKIVPLTHENICVGASCIASTLKLEAGDINMNMMPLYHIHGLSINVLASLLAGASLIATPGFSADEVLGWLALGGSKPNWYSAVPTMHLLVTERAEEAVSKHSMTHSLKLIRNCSAALLPWLSAKMEQIFGLNVMPTYAMTESMPICSNPRDDRGEDSPNRKFRRLSSVGFAAGPEVKVLDDIGLPCGVDCEGEVCVRGACVTPGYEFRAHMGEGNDPNVEAFHRLRKDETHSIEKDGDKWLRTGDKGFVDKDGYLTLVGRFKEIINHSGEKFSPFAVEEVLQQYPACKRLLAFAMPHETFGEVVGVAVVLNAGADIQIADLRAYGLEKGLPPKSLPEIIILMDAIPLGPTGKPARINLAGPDKCRFKMQPMTLSASQVVMWKVEAGQLVPIDGSSLHSSPECALNINGVQEAVIDVIASQLRTKRAAFSSNTKILEVGIDSVRVIHFARALQERFKCAIPTKAIVGGTVSSVAEAIVPLLGSQGNANATWVSSVAPLSTTPVQAPMSTSPSASLTIVDPSARLEKDVQVGHFCVIGKGAIIGEGTIIESHCVIEDGAVIAAGSFVGAFSVVGSNVTLGRETTLGTHCSFGGSGAIRVGAKNRFESHCRITSIAPWETLIGERNCFHSHVVLGFSPQDYNTRPKPSGGIIIGNDNVLREGVSIDAACGHDDGKHAVTKIGNRCYLMKNSHVAHDGLLDDNVTLTMNVQVAGYVNLMNNVNIGVGSVVHQFSTVGSYCMIGMGTAVTRDPLPFTTYMSRLGQSSEGSVLINRVGLQRAGKTEAEIDELEHFYQHIFSPLKGPLHGQIDSSRWYYGTFKTFDQHRANQERRRPVGDFLG